MTTGWIFDISLLCENSINQSIMHACGPTASHDYLIVAFLSSFVLFIFGFLGEVRLFRVLYFVPLPFPFCLESSTVLYVLLLNEGCFCTL